MRKQLSITPHTLGQLQMRRNGPRILLNSVPKSGTNLLQTCLSEFPNLLSLGHFYDDINVDALERYIKQLMPGQFATAHLEYSEHAEQLLAEESVKVVFIMRDPRDIAVSAVKYYLQINRNHMYGAYFHSLPDDETRLRVMLEGTPEMKDIHGHVLDFGQRMRMYMDWAL
ncbi:MAG: sulfotransferase domain-containing protein, partial [Candidatus Promineifilaceae bacterium]